MPSLGLSLGVPFRHGFGGGLPSSAFLLQHLVDPGDGITVNDNLDIVTPEPSYTSVPVLKFEGSGDFAVYTIPVAERVPVSSVNLTLEYRLSDSTIVTEMGMFNVRELPGDGNFFNFGFNTNTGVFRVFQGSTLPVVEYPSTPVALDTDWHTVEVTMVCETSVGASDGTFDILFDGGSILSETGCDLAVLTAVQINLGLLGFGTYANFHNDCYFKYVALEMNGTPYLACTCDEAKEPAAPIVQLYSNIVSKPLYMTVINSISGITVTRVSVDGPSSNAILNGFTEMANFNGIDQAITGTNEDNPASTDTYWDELEFIDLWVSGSNQIIITNASQTTRATLSINVSGGITAGLYYGIPFSTGDASVITNIPQGYHTLKLVWGPRAGEADGYSYWLDGDPLELDTYTTADTRFDVFNNSFFRSSLTAFIIGAVRTIQGVVKTKSTSTTIGSGTIVEDGRWTGNAVRGLTPNFLVPNFDTIEFVANNGVDHFGDAPKFDGGYVHNQAGAGMIQNSVDILDFVVMEFEDPIGSGNWQVLGYMPKTGTQEGRNVFQGTNGVSALVWEVSYLTDRWRIKQRDSAEIFAEELTDSPCPPLIFSVSAYPYAWRISHGYLGSFWADEDGEYVERFWYALDAHQTTDLMLCKLYEKSAAGNCQIKELAQYSLGYIFTTADRSSIAAWQGNSGCEVPSYPGFDSGFDTGFA